MLSLLTLVLSLLWSCGQDATALPLPNGGELCMTNNAACDEAHSQTFIVSVHDSLYNQLGCQERCHQEPKCEWYTWHEADDSVRQRQCRLYSSCGAANVSCVYCYTGPRSCYDADSQRAVAIIGGTDTTTTVNQVEVIEDTDASHCLQGTVADLPAEEARTRHASATVGQKLYVCGGVTERAPDAVTNSCLTYDLVQLNVSWTKSLPDMNSARSSSAAVSIYGELYVLGGDNGTHAHSSFEAFNYETGAWRASAPNASMSVGRAGLCAARLRDAIYVTGGYQLNMSLVKTFEMLNVTTQKWQVLASPQVGRRQHACLMLGDGSRLLVAGGYDAAGNVLASTEVFNLSLGAWEPGPDMVQARADFGLAVINGSATAVGGTGNDGQPLSSAEALSADDQHWSSIDLQLLQARAMFTVSGVSQCKKDY